MSRKPVPFGISRVGGFGRLSYSSQALYLLMWHECDRDDTLPRDVDELRARTNTALKRARILEAIEDMKREGLLIEEEDCWRLLDPDKARERGRQLARMSGTTNGNPPPNGHRMASSRPSDGPHNEPPWPGNDSRLDNSEAERGQVVDSSQPNCGQTVDSARTNRGQTVDSARTNRGQTADNSAPFCPSEVNDSDPLQPSLVCARVDTIRNDTIRSEVAVGSSKEARARDPEPAIRPAIRPPATADPTRPSGPEPPQARGPTTGATPAQDLPPEFAEPLARLRETLREVGHPVPELADERSRWRRMLEEFSLDELLATLAEMRLKARAPDSRHGPMLDLPTVVLGWAQRRRVNAAQGHVRLRASEPRTERGRYDPNVNHDYVGLPPVPGVGKEIDPNDPDIGWLARSYK